MTSSGRGASTSRRVDWRPLAAWLTVLPLPLCLVLAALVLAAPISPQHGHGDHHHAPANGRFSKPSEHISPLGTKSQWHGAQRRQPRAPLAGPRRLGGANFVLETFISRITVLYCTLRVCLLMRCVCTCVCTRTCCCCVCLLTCARLLQSSTSPARSCAMCTPPSRRITSTSPLCPPTGTGETSTDRTSCPRLVGRARESCDWGAALSFVFDILFVCLFVLFLSVFRI